MTVGLESSPEKITFCSFYRRDNGPNSRTFASQWMEQALDQTAANVVLGGDLNARHRLWSVEEDTAGRIIGAKIREATGALVMNRAGTVTRSEWAHSLRQRVRDSAIDVTIARCSTTPPDMKSWKVHAGYNSSDHFPITFSLHIPTAVPGKTEEPQLVVSKEAREIKRPFRSVWKTLWLTSPNWRACHWMRPLSTWQRPS